MNVHGFARQRPQAPANERFSGPETRRLPAVVSQSCGIPPVRGGGGVEGHASPCMGDRNRVRLPDLRLGYARPGPTEEGYASRYQARPAAPRPRDDEQSMSETSYGQGRLSRGAPRPGSRDLRKPMGVTAGRDRHPTNDTRGSGESGMKANRAEGLSVGMSAVAGNPLRRYCAHGLAALDPSRVSRDHRPVGQRGATDD